MGPGLSLGSGVRKGCLVASDNLYSALAVCQAPARLSQPLLLPPKWETSTWRGQETSSKANASDQDFWEGRQKRLALMGVFWARMPLAYVKKRAPLGWLESGWRPAQFRPLQLGALDSDSEDKES